MPIDNTVKRTAGRIPYTVVPNFIFELNNADAIAMYCYLLSKPDNWIVRKADIMKSLGIGEQRYKNGREVLQATGLWVTANVTGEDGRFQGKVIWITTEVPENRMWENLHLRSSSTLGESAPLVSKDVLVSNNSKPPMSGKPDHAANGKESKALLEFLNEKTGRKYQPVPANLKLIEARINEYGEQPLRSMIAMKVRKWKTDEKMKEFLRPKTLFNATNCANYIGELL